MRSMGRCERPLSTGLGAPARGREVPPGDRLSLAGWCLTPTGGRCGGGSAGSGGCVVVEIAFLDGDDVVGLELILFLLVIIQVNGAPFGTDAIQRLRRFEDVVRLGIPL